MRTALAAGLLATAVALAGCAGILGVKPRALGPVRLTAPERNAVSAMEDSADIQFLKRPVVTAVTSVHVYGTNARRISLIGPLFVRPGVCAIGMSYKVTVYSSLVVTYAPEASHQYDQETYKLGPGVGNATVTCK